MANVLEMPVPKYTPETVTRNELDEMVCNWREAKAARLELQKQVDKIEELEKVLKQFIMDAIQAQKFEGLVSDGRVTGVQQPRSYVGVHFRAPRHGSGVVPTEHQGR
jgi:hypothetical protein